MRLVSGKDVWELRVYLGRDETGRVRHLHRRFQGTKRQAERALARLSLENDGTSSQVDAERPVWNERTTINDAITSWSKNGWEDLSPTTVRHYEQLWERYIRSTIGRRRIADLSPYDVERYFRSLKANGAGRTTLRHIRGILHRACRLAVKWSSHRLPNPIADTELPTFKLEERREPVRSPSPKEVCTLMVAAHEHDQLLGLFVRVVTATGMRRGEACAIRWSDVDFDDLTICVDESVVSGRGSATVKAPKTRASIRTLAIDDKTVQALQRFQEHQIALAQACGLTLSNDGFVFSYEPGGLIPPHPDSLSHSFAAVRKNAGVAPDIHLHSLRHFHATVLDPVISEAQKQARLGWSTVQMARHYTDVVPEEDRRAAEHVGRLLGSEVTPASSVPD
jgi:integrase